ncbi:hypothetical protein E2320_003720, partial [Naja naja]
MNLTLKALAPTFLKKLVQKLWRCGRRASGYQVESVDGKTCLTLPTLIECNQIPDHRSEIPMPDAVIHHPYLNHLAHLIPELNPQAQILAPKERYKSTRQELRSMVPTVLHTFRNYLGWVIKEDPSHNQFFLKKPPHVTHFLVPSQAPLVKILPMAVTKTEQELVKEDSDNESHSSSLQIIETRYLTNKEQDVHPY